MAKTFLCALLSSFRIDIYIFVLMTTVRFAVSQPSATDCVLDFQYLSSNYNSSLIEGDWSGFLPRNCSGSAFLGYLYALGLRANKTGLIYLNPSEQRSCLTKMARFGLDVFSCGIKKLTSGYGGCSDLSVAKVTDGLGVTLKKLTENCELDGSEVEGKELRGSCLKTWQEIGGINFKSTNPEYYSESETHVCWFAVVIALTSSRIDDKAYVQGVYKFLGNQSTTFSENDEAESKTKQGINKGTWILLGVLLGIAAVIITIIPCIGLRRCKKPNHHQKKNAFNNLQLKDSRCANFPIKEVYFATENLDEKNLIGEGTAGKVYKGVLSNHQHVAIKHIINDGSAETVVREVTSLSHIRHPNLVALLGYCVREDECFVIYELCPNGNLSQWIFGKDRILTWTQRLRIAIDSARGLQFLHTYSEGCIVHRDVKPTNILLGPNFEAKLSDFGLSKVIELGETYMSSEVRGTFGYVDPQYQNNHKVNSSGDVYSFGIVLLQILSGRKVINMNLNRPMPLDKMAKSLIRGGSIVKFVDPKLEGEYSAEAFDLTLQLALSCTSLDQQRPSMEQVVLKLEEALSISTQNKLSP